MLQVGPMGSDFDQNYLSHTITYTARMICARCKRPQKLTFIESEQIKIYFQQMHTDLIERKLKPFTDPTLGVKHD